MADRGSKSAACVQCLQSLKQYPCCTGGAPRNNIALALHAAVVERTCGMLQRVGFEQPLVFTGGVANNHCIVKLLEAKLGVKVMVPKEPQLVGALGAAIAAAV